MNVRTRALKLLVVRAQDKLMRRGWMLHANSRKPGLLLKQRKEAEMRANSCNSWNSNNGSRQSNSSKLNDVLSSKHSKSNGVLRNKHSKSSGVLRSKHKVRV